MDDSVDVSGASRISDEVADHLWRRRYQVLHRIQLAIRYHNKRERFFDTADRFITAFTALSATSAVALLLQRTAPGVAAPNWLEISLAACAAFLSAIAVSYSPGARSRLHAQLAAEFRRVWIECVAAGEDWEEKHCNGFEAKVLQAEVGEPPALGALVTQCENEMALAAGQPQRIRVLNWRQKWFMHFWNFDTTGCPIIAREKADELLPSTPARPDASGGQIGGVVGDAAEPQQRRGA